MTDQQTTRVRYAPPALQQRRSGGRPTREEAARRDARLLDIATTLFMERGFDGTSMDAVAEAAGVSKPTVYNRYQDKRDLFAAVLRSRIKHWLAPLSAAAESHVGATGVVSIDETLHLLSREILTHSMTPDTAMLQRVVAAQAVHFPELAKLAHEEGWLRAVRAVAALLHYFAKKGQINVDNPEVAADLFLNLVLGHSRRLALFGITVDPAIEELHRRKAVELFLNGIRTR